MSKAVFIDLGQNKKERKLALKTFHLSPSFLYKTWANNTQPNKVP
jgi:hypothetical protein